MTDISTDKLIENILQIPAEDRITELKRLGKDFNISKALDSIVAMSNTDGGFLILGIDDPQKTKLKGIDRVFGIEESPEKYDDLSRGNSTDFATHISCLATVIAEVHEQQNNGGYYYLKIVEYVSFDKP